MRSGSVGAHIRLRHVMSFLSSVEVADSYIGGNVAGSMNCSSLTGGLDESLCSLGGKASTARLRSAHSIHPSYFLLLEMMQLFIVY